MTFTNSDLQIEYALQNFKILEELEEKLEEKLR